VCVLARRGTGADDRRHQQQHRYDRAGFDGGRAAIARTHARRAPSAVASNARCRWQPYLVHPRDRDRVLRFAALDPDGVAVMRLAPDGNDSSVEEDRPIEMAQERRWPWLGQDLLGEEHIERAQSRAHRRGYDTDPRGGEHANGLPRAAPRRTRD
jgi:hypothetical protein